MTPEMRLALLRAPTHPALRWTPVNARDNRQHRRLRDTEWTVCGLRGPLALAEATDERCTEGCWG